MTLRNPANGSTTSDNTPTFSGTGGTASGDLQKVTVKVYAGTSVSGSPVQTLAATMSQGNWSVTPTHALADGTYTAQAQQSDKYNNTGFSNASTFTVQTKAPPPPPPPATYSVGGSLSGASGAVVLQDNGGDDLSVSANGSFAFATKIATGGAYNVTVKTAPSGQQCSVANGSGTVGSANVTNVAVTCAATPSQSGADDFNRSDGGLGANWTAMSDGALSIKSQQVTGPTAGTDAGDIRTAPGESYGSDQYSQITLTANSVGIGTGGEGEWVGPSVRSQNGGQDTYLGMYFYNSGSPQLRLYRRNGGTWTQLGGNVNSGVLPAGTQLTLSAVGSQISLLENGAAQITVTDTTLTGGAPGIMTHDAATADDWSGGDPATLPPPATYSVGGTASGVSGTLVLQDNGGDDLNVSANGSFTFPTKIASGGAYSVAVKSSPSGESCSVSNGSGTIGSANVTNVAVTCVTSSPPPPNSYSIGGIVSGLSGIVVLQDNGGDDLNVSANGSFTFPTKIASGATYQVTVASNPAGQTCTVAGGSGTVGSANVTTVTVTCAPASSQVGADDFNRADSNGLGAGWTAINEGGLAIQSQHVIGAAAPNYAGDIRTAAGESYGSDQYSQIELTANSVGIGTGGAGEWVGPSVRSQNGGQDAYLGMYFYNGGSPQLRLYRRNGGTWTQLGASVGSGVLPAGTQLTLTAVGSRISLAENGVAQITVTDTTVTGGAPGIMTYDAATADNWSGGNADALPPPEKMQVQFDHTDGGVDYYNVISSDDGGGAQVLRVVNPTNPAPGVPHNFLFALPVEPGTQTTYGDGIATLQQLNAQNQYNLTVIEPSFGAEPWYADNPTNPDLQYETFMSDDLVPWVVKNLATSGDEQNWLLGFSKSGFGAQDLILKHPDVFTVAGSWDFPADMDAYTSDQGRYVGDGVDYGTDANFQANYRLTASFVNAHKAPFQNANRLWIGGYQAFQSDVADYDALLTSDGMKHTTETPPQLMAHRWDSGWVQIALSALSAEAAALPRGP